MNKDIIKVVGFVLVVIIFFTALFLVITSYGTNDQITTNQVVNLQQRLGNDYVNLVMIDINESKSFKVLVNEEEITVINETSSGSSYKIYHLENEDQVVVKTVEQNKIVKSLTITQSKKGNTKLDPLVLKSEEYDCFYNSVANLYTQNDKLNENEIEAASIYWINGWKFPSYSNGNITDEDMSELFKNQSC